MPGAVVMPSDPDRAAISDHVRRTVEHAALRKVRKLTRRLEDEQASRTRTERKAMITIVIVGLVTSLFFAALLVGLMQWHADSRQQAEAVGSAVPPAGGSAATDR